MKVLFMNVKDLLEWSRNMVVVGEPVAGKMLFYIFINKFLSFNSVTKYFNFRICLKFIKYFFFLLVVFFFFLCSLSYWYIDFSVAGFQYFLEIYLFETFFLFGVDSIGMIFLYLTSLIIPLCLLFNWNNDKGLNTQEECFFFFYINSYRNIISDCIY